MSAPKCFISHSWDSDEHKGWVLKLAEHLTGNGVKIILDQWDLRLGSDLPSYMETSVRDSEFVILVCTPTFAKKANAGIGGVGYEKCIVTGEMFSCISSPEKFVPILRCGAPKESIPSYLRHKFFVDFRDDKNFQDSLEELLRHVHNIPRHQRPPLGLKPTLSNRESVPIVTDKKIVYCSRCGQQPGQSKGCSGM